mgnify:CR=1 FL=1
MNPKNQPDQPAKSQFLVYAAEDGRVKIEVRLEGETVWLTQQHMADLFQTTQQNVSLHLQNIYAEGELRREATHKEFLSVRQEGHALLKNGVHRVHRHAADSGRGKRRSSAITSVLTISSSRWTTAQRSRCSTKTASLSCN